MKLIAFDVETSGLLPEYALQPWRVDSGEAWLTSCAWQVSKGVDVFNPDLLDHTKEPDVEAIRQTLKEAAINSVRIAAWNAPFDAAWLIALGLRDEVFACQWIDVMLMYKHLYQQATHVTNKRSFSLKAGVAHFYPSQAGYEDDVDFHDTSPESLAKLRAYNKKDCIFTEALAQKFWLMMSPEMRKVVLVEAATIPLAADSLYNGIRIDLEAAKELKKDLKREANVAIVKLSLDDPRVTPKVLASPQQLGELLFQQWRLPIYSSTPTGFPSVDKLALKTLAAKDERAAQVYTYREATMNAKKFADGAITSCKYNEGDITHPAFRIFGTYTGRGTYSSRQGKGKSERPTGVAIHQWKRDQRFRKLITVPEGFKLLEFDFAGQEYRWMAVESNDPTMLGLCQPGEDAHSFMGSKFSGVQYKELQAAVAVGNPEAKKTRQLGKVANLSLQYRTSAPKLVTMALAQHNVVLSGQQAAKLHRLYRTTYPGVEKYWERQQNFVRTHRYVRNMLGRQVMLGPNHVGWADESTAVNFPIQSMGADQKYLALLVAKNMLSKYGGYFYLELHDGLFFVIPDDKAETALYEMGVELSNLPYKDVFNLDLPIQFPVDAKIGPSWGELKEVKYDFTR